MTLFKVIAASLAAAATSASAAGPPVAYGPHPAPADYNPVAPPVYAFEYGVADDYSGANFGHSENRNNYDTTGEYRVNLPDGRVQIVTYSAGPDGYVADVKYEGEAHYDEYKPAPYKPAPKPVYKPAPAPASKPAPKPVYKPAPVYHKPAPVYHKPAPYHPAPVYHAAPAYHKPAPAYTPKRTYSFKPVTEAAPAAEAKAAEPVVEAR